MLDVIAELWQMCLSCLLNQKCVAHLALQCHSQQSSEHSETNWYTDNDACCTHSSIVNSSVTERKITRFLTDFERSPVTDVNMPTGISVLQSISECQCDK